MTKLFVGGLPYTMDNQKLNELFSQFGQVISANIISDKYTNQSKGFGFVEMADDNAAQEAIKALDGSDLEGRRIGVSVARPKEDRSNFNSDNRRSDFRDNRGFNRGGRR